MKSVYSGNVLSIVLSAVVSINLLAGCGRADQTADSGVNQGQVDQPAVGDRPLGQVTEFDGFVIRANVSRTEFLPDAMARQYGIEPGPNLALLNVVILDQRPDQQTGPVAAELNVHYESLVGHAEVIDMRAAEADGYVSYIGTLNVTGQRVFRFVIEAQPVGTDEPLRMSFEVQLDPLDTE